MERLRLVGWLAAAALLAAAVAAAEPLVPLPAQPAGVPWPTDAWPTAPPGAGVDVARLEAAADAAFATKGWSGLPDTRALLAVHRGVLVFERYAPGFGPDSRFPSWSMAKTVTQALVGVLVGQGRLDVRAAAPVAAWRGDGDPRGAITLDHLLRMTSGLDNADGEGESKSFATQLLFGAGSRDEVAFASAVRLVHPPGTHWAYSTGTSAILAGIIGGTVGGGPRDVLAFMRAELFEPIGMRTVVPEFDAAGTFVGGAFVWATARDWARLGFLYLRDGQWDGRRIFPAGWVDYSRTPAPAENNAVYGAHLWVNVPPKDGQFEPLPGAAPSAFTMSGLGGQFVMVAPAQDLVVVRLGEAQGLGFRGATGIPATVAAAFPASEAP